MQSRQGNVQTPQGFGGIALLISPYMASADITFTRDDLFIHHRINPSAGITITMPLLLPGDDFQITNAGDGTHTVTVKDSTATITISSLTTSGDTSVFLDAIAAGVPTVTPT